MAAVEQTIVVVTGVRNDQVRIDRVVAARRLQKRSEWLPSMASAQVRRLLQHVTVDFRVLTDSSSAADDTKTALDSTTPSTLKAELNLAMARHTTSYSVQQVITIQAIVTSVTTPTPSASHGDGGINIVAIVMIAIGSIFLGVVAVLGVCLCRGPKRSNRNAKTFIQSTACSNEHPKESVVGAISVEANPVLSLSGNANATAGSNALGNDSTNELVVVAVVVEESEEYLQGRSAKDSTEKDSGDDIPEEYMQGNDIPNDLVVIAELTDEKSGLQQGADADPQTPTASTASSDHAPSTPRIASIESEGQM
jgi:hypothetical protein